MLAKIFSPVKSPLLAASRRPSSLRRMSASPEFVDFAQELFAPLGGVSIRRMFGGAGLYCRGLMFGLIHDDTIYLKADAERSEEHTSELQSLMRISYAVFCLKKKNATLTTAHQPNRSTI